MKLMTNEEKILASNGDKVVLTNHRIQMTEVDWGSSFTISIFLEDISSVEQKYDSIIILIILAIASVAGGLYIQSNGQSNGMIIGLIVGGIFMIIWWFTRQNKVYISSNGGGTMIFKAAGMSDSAISDFLFNVQSAKQKRVNQLYNQLNPAKAF